MALNNDRAYREVGKAWTFGAVAMIVRSDPANGVERAAGIILDVHAGECRSARFVEGTDDPADAEFVIVGSYARWKDVIEGKLDPIKGMMEGKLKLTRGADDHSLRRTVTTGGVERQQSANGFQLAN
jgi:putative sterol carrier protein